MVTLIVLIKEGYNMNFLKLFTETLDWSPLLVKNVLRMKKERFPCRVISFFSGIYAVEIFSIPSTKKERKALIKETTKTYYHHALYIFTDSEKEEDRKKVILSRLWGNKYREIEVSSIEEAQSVLMHLQVTRKRSLDGLCLASMLRLIDEVFGLEERFDDE